LVGWLGGAYSSPAEQSLLGVVISRFEQLSAPLAAKAVEDTAFYRYGRLLALNEVGGSPASFSLANEAFHERMERRNRTYPFALSPLATHDHKRGPDARARLAVLSDHPEVLGTLARDVATTLQKIAQPDQQQIAPTDLLMLLQSALGAWPPSLDVDDPSGCARLKERLAGWQNKALREAKQHSNWVIPVTEYEAVAHGVLDSLFADSNLRQTMYQAVQRLSAPGAVNSLAQVLLQCTAPGIPDIYQGSEMWDFSLVDPDNRMPVDFGAHDKALDHDARLSDLLLHWRDGRVKQALVARVLRWRRNNHDAIARSRYRPVTIEGPKAPQVLCFARDSSVGTLLVVVPRNISEVDRTTLLWPAKFWKKTVAKPDAGRTGDRRGWTDLLFDRVVPGGLPLAIGELLEGFPVALLLQAATANLE
jgi:(1->4)-alpha-D-glucan 1-alpha-D-glucosylmutase